MRKFLSGLLALAVLTAPLWAGATFSRVKTWSNGETLTATDLNAEFDNILNNLTTGGVDDYSATASQMQTITDPFPLQAVSLATSLQGEIERLRYQIKQLKATLQYGTTYTSYWYEDLPGASNFTVTGSSNANVGINIATPTASLDINGSLKVTSGTIQTFYGNIDNATVSTNTGINFYTYGAGMDIKDEGTLQGGATSMNLVGAGVTGSLSGKVLTVTVPANASTSATILGLVISTEGANLNLVQASATYINVMGDFYVNYSTKADISKNGPGGLDDGSEQANLWYSIWAISNGAGTQAGILLSSSTGNAPYLLPSGYVKYTRIGWVRNTSSNFLPFWKYGKRVQYLSEQYALNTGSPASSLTTIDFSAIISSTAYSADLSIDLDETSGSVACITLKDEIYNTTNEPFIGVSIGGATAARFRSTVPVSFGVAKRKQYKQYLTTTMDQVWIVVLSYEED